MAVAGKLKIGPGSAGWLELRFNPGILDDN